MAGENIPWDWQDIAALVGCCGALALAFRLRWRTRRAGSGGGCEGCARGATSPPGSAPPVVIPEGRLSLGRVRRAPR